MYVFRLRLGYVRWSSENGNNDDAQEKLKSDLRLQELNHEAMFC
jgi:hypothetical protein